MVEDPAEALRHVTGLVRGMLGLGWGCCGGWGWLDRGGGLYAAYASSWMIRRAGAGGNRLSSTAPLQLAWFLLQPANH